MSVPPILADAGFPPMPWFVPFVKGLLVTGAILGTVLYSTLYILVTVLATLKLQVPWKRRAAGAVARGILGATALWTAAIGIVKAVAHDAPFFVVALVPIGLIVTQAALWALVFLACCPGEVRSHFGCGLVAAALGALLLLHFTIDAAFLVGACILLWGVGGLFPAASPLLS